MKLNTLIVLLCCLAQIPVLAQERTDPPAWQVASDAAKACAGVRSNVANELAVRIRAQVLDERGLGVLLAALQKASNDLAQAEIEKKAAATAERIQSLSATASALLKDAGNQPLVRKLGPEKWQRELLVQAAQAKMLAAALCQLSGVVCELRDWATVEQQIVPPPELSGVLKSRLGELVSDWEKNGPAVGDSPEETNPPPFDASPATQDVVKLLRARVAEPVILVFIRAEKRPYDLIPRHVVYLKNTAAPPAVISAMQRHDEALRSGQQASRR